MNERSKTQNMCDAAKYGVDGRLSVFKWADGYKAMTDNAPTSPSLASATQPQADALDAARYRELIDYFISDRVDLDDALVAAKSTDEISKIIDAAIASKGDSA